jgi:Ser/Thr protein kinase RdoA (MazF antagonist)
MNGTMDPSIAARFHPRVLDRARECYAIEKDSIRLLDGFESFMYEFERPDGRFILRLSHSLRRSADQIRGEVDWINYLHRGQVGVARAIFSEREILVEEIDDGLDGRFLCTAFVRAPGTRAAKWHFTERLFRNYGRTLGRMHALSKDYEASSPSWKRPEWDSPENIALDRWFQGEMAPLLDKCRPLLDHLRSLPRDRDSYGMIHQDAHPGNFFVDEDCNITLFDFDDCVFGHFIYDLAMPLFYCCSWGEDRTAFTARFMPVFLSAYAEENRLDLVWIRELPNYLKLREIDLFAQINYSIKDAGNSEDPWLANFVRGRREKILNDVPFIEYDWESLRGCM